MSDASGVDKGFVSVIGGQSKSSREVLGLVGNTLGRDVAANNGAIQTTLLLGPFSQSVPQEVRSMWRYFECRSMTRHRKNLEARSGLFNELQDGEGRVGLYLNLFCPDIDVEVMHKMIFESVPVDCQQRNAQIAFWKGIVKANRKKGMQRQAGSSLQDQSRYETDSLVTNVTKWPDVYQYCDLFREISGAVNYVKKYSLRKKKWENTGKPSRYTDRIANATSRLKKLIRELGEDWSLAEVLECERVGARNPFFIDNHTSKLPPVTSLLDLLEKKAVKEADETRRMAMLKNARSHIHVFIRQLQPYFESVYGRHMDVELACLVNLLYGDYAVSAGHLRELREARSGLA